jgi:hypothetical protein
MNLCFRSPFMHQVTPRTMQEIGDRKNIKVHPKSQIRGSRLNSFYFYKGGETSIR